MPDEELGFSQIYGASGGGQNLSDMMSYLFNVANQQGWFGQDYTGTLSPEISGISPYQEPPAGSGMMSLGQLMPGMQNPDLGGASYDVPTQMSFDDLLSALTTGDSPFMQGLSDVETQGYGALGSLLQNLNLGGRTSEYRQDVGDIRSEIGGQIGGLQKNYPLKQKGTRYGGLGTMGKTLGGSRMDYLSDIYGLRKKQQQMTSGLQEGYGEDFYSDLMYQISTMQAPDFD